MEIDVLGIESSCDETAASVYSSTSGVLSNVLFSSAKMQSEFGGVVPELASRSHLEKINLVVQTALNEAKTSLNEIDVIAVTTKPGLPGSLLIGLCFAKTIAWALNKKLIGVNHLEGHAFSSFLENNIPFPHLCLTASGGHTNMYLMHDFGKYEIIGQTIDDAAGEAFDKIAKFINLTYPGGPVIEKLASEVNFEDFFKYPRPMQNLNIESPLNFSFSGLKTAVLYDLVKQNAFDIENKKFLRPNDLELQKKVASSLLVCIRDIFIQKIKLALKKYPHIKSVSFVGGVACNKYLKNQLKEFCENKNIQFFSPSPQYCTDNAAMIAFVGCYKAMQGKFDNLELDIF